MIVRSVFYTFCFFSVFSAHAGFLPGKSVPLNNPEKYAADTLKKRKAGSPLDNLPKNIEVLTGFGNGPIFRRTVSGLHL